MSKLAKALTAAAGNAGESLYVEDVYSTYLYEGTGSGIAINNGIDLSGEGGLVIYRRRDGAENWSYQDTIRGVDSVIYSDNTNAAADPGGYGLASFNSNGFTTELNTNGADYASWTFRKAPKFFDVQTWTGNSTAGRTIAHNLGSAPAFVLVKRTNATNNWICWHSALTNTQYIQINSTSQAFSDGGIFWNSTTPDASNLTLGNDSGVNGSGSTYVAYLFASDAGGFGDDGSENIIKCGSYTGNGSFSSGPVIDLGFEPQWVLIKNATTGGYNWQLGDTLRGASTEGAQYLTANTSNQEAAFSGGYTAFIPTATGFTMTVDDSNYNRNGDTYIYIAIRRPMKTPESGTEVFLASTAASGVQIATGFNVDLWINGSKDGSAGINAQLTMDRKRGANYLRTTQTTADTSTNNPFTTGPSNTFTNITQGGSGVAWMFKRATGFMDVVAYTGNATVRTVPHNLGVVPELMIVKKRNAVKNWFVYSAADSTKYLYLNGTNAFVSGSAEQIFGNDSTTVAPTSSVFSLGSQAAINGSGDTFINYLFASVAGVSKVGSYTGTAADLNVDCGFSAGARFILIKRTDSTGDWYVWDSARGIVAGNDPYLLLNSTAAEVTNTDYIDPLSSGFTVTSSASSTVNVSSGTYIFLAIA